MSMVEMRLPVSMKFNAFRASGSISTFSPDIVAKEKKRETMKLHSSLIRYPMVFSHRSQLLDVIVLESYQ